MGKGGVVSQIVARVNIFAPGLLKPPTPWFPGWGGAEGEDRALQLSALRSFSRERPLNGYRSNTDYRPRSAV